MKRSSAFFERFVRFSLCVSILFSANNALSITLSDYHKDTVSDKCPVETWNIVYKTCPATECPDEQYGHREAEENISENGICPDSRLIDLLAYFSCHKLMQTGEYQSSCEGSCINKSKLSRLAYFDMKFKAKFYRIRDSFCRAKDCGEESRTPTSYLSCRHLDHEIDDARIVAAMNTGRGIDRAAALLAKAIKETQNLPNNVRNLITDLLNAVTADSAEAEAKIDSIRQLLLKNGEAISENDVREIWAESYPQTNSLRTVSVQKNNKISNISVNQLKIDPTIAIEKLQRTLLSRSLNENEVNFFSSAIDSTTPIVNSFSPPTAPSWDYSGYIVGYGVNSVTGGSEGKCIIEKSKSAELSFLLTDTHQDEQTETTETKKLVSYALDKIEDHQSLLQSLFASASISVAAGVGKANASSQFSQTFESSEHSIYLIAKVSVSLPESIYEFKDLDDEWKKIQNSGEVGRKRFYDGCGDLYVLGMRSGANFVALYQLIARDDIEKQNLIASFKGSGTTGTFSTSAQFIKALNRVHNFTHVNSKILSLGYPGGTIPDSAEGIVDYARNFPDKVTEKNAYPITATTHDYSDFPSFQTGTPLLDNQQREYLKQADIDFQWLLSRRSVINYAKSEPNLFDWGEHKMKDLIASEREIIKLTDALTEQASACFMDVTKCKGYEPIEQSKIWVPSMQAKAILVGGCSEKIARFGNYNGGCLDTSTGLTWSAPSRSYWTFDQAKNYCQQLTENQTKGWVLPSIFEVDSLKSPNGGAEGFKEGGSLNDWFWAHDGDTEKRGVRANIENGTRKEGEDTLLKYRVICRQG